MVAPSSRSPPRPSQLTLRLSRPSGRVFNCQLWPMAMSSAWRGLNTQQRFPINQTCVLVSEVLFRQLALLASWLPGVCWRTQQCMLVTRPLLLLVFRSDKGMSPASSVSPLMASGLGETSSLNWDPLHMLPPPPDLHALLKVS